MASCQQSRHQTILQHGEAVSSKFKDLIAGRTDRVCCHPWQLPTWFTENRELLFSRLPEFDVLETYHIYHDCGKPYCRTVDAEGRTHFPDHARVSAAIWRVLGGDPFIARLIEHDMDMHLLKPAGAKSYPHLDIAPTLLLTALAELHANAGMFGGTESLSFKIKWKNLSKIGTILLNRIKEQS